MQQFIQLIGCPVDRVVLDNAAKSLQRHDGVHTPRVNGGHQTQQAVPAFTDRLGQDVERGGILQTVWHLQAMRQVRLALRQIMQSGTQIEVEQLDYRYPRVRVSMGIHGKTEQPAAGAGLAMAYHALDCNAGLVLVGHHGLVADGPVLAQRVRIDPDSMNMAARVGASVEQVG